MEISNDFMELQQIRLNLFKSQNPESGRYDVIFDVQGKLLYAHKNMLSLVSDTFDSMLSDRWTKKDEPIKIQDYSYNDFYQFFIYLYSGQCQLTETNIYAMVDMAEFYCVDLFKRFCQRYLLTIKFTVENIFEFMNLANKYSINQLKASVKNFISNNIITVIKSNEFTNVKKDIAKALVVAYKYKPEPEDLFEAVYKWSEKQAMDKQAADSNINLDEAIKAEISDFLPFIFFQGMERNFLHDYVVPRGLIFSSLNELGKILRDRERFFEGKVKVTNEHGQTLHGNVITDKTVLRNIESLKLLPCSYGSVTTCWWDTKFTRPSTPSSFKKRDGVEWYLCYYSDGSIGVTNYANVGKGHYLLAELTVGSSGFQSATGCKIEIE